MGKAVNSLYTQDISGAAGVVACHPFDVIKVSEYWLLLFSTEAFNLLAVIFRAGFNHKQSTLPEIGVAIFTGLYIVYFKINSVDSTD